MRMCPFGAAEPFTPVPPLSTVRMFVTSEVARSMAEADNAPPIPAFTGPLRLERVSPVNSGLSADDIFWGNPRVIVPGPLVMTT